MPADKSEYKIQKGSPRPVQKQSDLQRSNMSLWRDQRRYRRVELNIETRFLLPDQSEHTGKVLDVSAGGVAIGCEARPEIADKIVVYIDQMGGYEGKVIRLHETGFSVEFESSPLKRERTVDQLTWLTNNPKGAAEERQHSRNTVTKNSSLERHDGSHINCCIIDMSMGGLAIQIADKPPIGEIIMIGRTEGRVVRHFSEGIGIEFLHMPGRKRSLTQALF